MTVHTIHASRSLTQLVDDARIMADRARTLGLRHAAHALDQCAAQLDAERTALVQEGEPELWNAWAWIDTAPHHPRVMGRLPRPQHRTTRGARMTRLRIRWADVAAMVGFCVVAVLAVLVFCEAV